MDSFVYKHIAYYTMVGIHGSMVHCKKEFKYRG